MLCSPVHDDMSMRREAGLDDSSRLAGWRGRDWGLVIESWELGGARGGGVHRYLALRWCCTVQYGTYMYVHMYCGSSSSRLSMYDAALRQVHRRAWMQPAMTVTRHTPHRRTASGTFKSTWQRGRGRGGGRGRERGGGRGGHDETSAS